MNRVRTFVNNNKPDVNLNNISNSFQSFKSKITNISFNNETKEQEGTEQVRTRSIRSLSNSSSKSNKTSFVRDISNSLFSSNKENYDTTNININSNKINEEGTESVRTRSIRSLSSSSSKTSFVRDIGNTISNTFSNTIFSSNKENVDTNNNKTKEQKSSEPVRTRSIRSVSSSSSKSSKTSFVRDIGNTISNTFSNTIFSSNKENVDTNNINDDKALNNLNAKDVSRVSKFAANHPSIAKKGLQAAAYASGDKEMAKKIGQTSTKDIQSTATKINKGANFVVENQDTINEFNKYANGNSNTSPLNKFINSSAISNSGANSTMRSTPAPAPAPSIPTHSASKISAPPPLPGRINNDIHVTRNNSTSMSTPRSVNTDKLGRSNTIGSSPSPVSNNVPNTTKFNKPPPPPVPRHKPDLDKMTEVITSSTSNNTTSRGVAAPPPLPNRPSPSKLKRSGSDSKLFNEGTDTKNRNTITRGGTQPITYQRTEPQRAATTMGIRSQSYNNDCANEIQHIFNISMPSDNINRYSNVFVQVADNNLVTDSTVKALWMQSGISKATLAKIWTFVNRKLDGLLEKSEFIVGMYLIDQYLNGYDIEYYFNVK